MFTILVQLKSGRYELAGHYLTLEEALPIAKRLIAKSFLHVEILTRKQGPSRLKELEQAVANRPRIPISCKSEFIWRTVGTHAAAALRKRGKRKTHVGRYLKGEFC